MPDSLPFSEKKNVESFLKLGKDIIPGKINIDTDKCIGCMLCAKACATGVLEVINKKARMVEELPVCIGCCDCVAICSEDAISFVQLMAFKKAFRFLDRGEKSVPRRF